MLAIQDPVCHLTRKEKAGIWDTPRPKSKVRRPITGRHHLATDPKRTSNHPAGKLTSPKSQQFTSGTTRKCDDSPTLLQSTNILSRSSQQQHTEALLYSFTWASVFCMGRVKLKVCAVILWRYHGDTSSSSSVSSWYMYACKVKGAVD